MDEYTIWKIKRRLGDLENGGCINLLLNLFELFLLGLIGKYLAQDPNWYAFLENTWRNFFK